MPIDRIAFLEAECPRLRYENEKLRTIRHRLRQLHLLDRRMVIDTEYLEWTNHFSSLWANNERPGSRFPAEAGRSTRRNADTSSARPVADAMITTVVRAIATEEGLMAEPKILQGHSSTYRLKSDRPAFLGRLSVLYLAENMKSGDEVVLKTFREEIAEPGAIKSFYAELDALQALVHPNILPILDYGESIPGESPYFLALPYCRGGNLRGSLAGAQFLPIGTASPLLRQIATAIDYAHGQGVIHGDIKPENVLLSGKGSNAFLADFGIARHFAVMERVATASAPPGVGSSLYLSPEQLSANKRSTKSDIYAFGLVAFELLTGRLPFDVAAPPFQQMLARVSGELTHPQEANPALSAEVSKALLQVLDRDPAARPRSALAFCNLLAPTKKWDLFIAYASPDRPHADRLYSMLSTRYRVFLDHRCLLPGDEWGAAIAAAQRDALITVILVSTKSEGAYYQRDEVAAAIDLARRNPDTHRVVPVYLEPAVADVVPYGLRIKHGIVCEHPESYDLIVEKLSTLVDKLISYS